MDLSNDEMFKEFHGKTTFQDTCNYALSKVTKPTRIDVVREIIGGPKTMYKCVNIDQSYYIFHYCKNNLLDIAEKTKCAILFMEDCSTDEMDGFLIVTLKPRMYNNIEHLVLYVT